MCHNKIYYNFQVVYITFTLSGLHKAIFPIFEVGTDHWQETDRKRKICTGSSEGQGHTQGFLGQCLLSRISRRLWHAPKHSLGILILQGKEGRSVYNFVCIKVILLSECIFSIKITLIYLWGYYSSIFFTLAFLSDRWRF